MPAAFDITTHDEHLEVSFGNPPDVTVLRAAAALLRQSAYVRFEKQLWDVSGGFDLSTADLRAMAETGRRRQLTPGFRAAIVAPSDLHYGLLRMFGAWRNADDVVRPFRDFDAARDWLGIGRCRSARR